MEKFRLQPNEQTLMKGDLMYSQGEAGLANFIKGKFRVIQCTAWVTSQRFVACKKRQYYPWGPLIWLIRVFIKRKILFAIPMDNLASIKFEAGKSKYFTLQATDGAEFKVESAGFFDKKNKWVDAIRTAVVQSCPDTKIEATDILIKFSRAMASNKN